MIFNHALIMAAGRGQRMMPITEHIPKPMINFRGMSLISHGIEQIKPFIPNIHITVGYKATMLAGHVMERKVSTVIYTEGKSNSWWVYNSLLKYLDEPLLVLTCDNIVDLNLRVLMDDYINSGKPPCMLVPVIPIAGLEGDYIFQKGGIVYELNRDKVSPIYCSGIQILIPKSINKITKFNEGDNFYTLWNQLIKKKQLKCSNIYPDKWISIDSIQQLNSF
jgi:NDP-sugar pyrophosphorylase family protein